MLNALYADILRDQGFKKIGEITHQLDVSVWWNEAPDRLLQVLVLSVGRIALIRADKTYHMKTIGAEAATWSRDIGALGEWLKTHFSQVTIGFSWFRDLPKELAELAVKRQVGMESSTDRIVTVEQLSQLQRQAEALQRGHRSTLDLSAFAGRGELHDLLGGYLRQKMRTEAAELKQLQEKVQKSRQQLEFLEHVQREYLRKGSAASYTFTISSNLQCVNDPHEFRDAVDAVVKQIADLDRYHIRQQLNGGRLNIQVAVAREPALNWIQQWFGGGLTPKQLERLGPEFDRLKAMSAEHTMVSLDEPAVVAGQVRQPEQPIAARVLSTMLHRLDRTENEASDDRLRARLTAPEAMPLWIGKRIDEKGTVTDPAILPLKYMVHAHVSGTTGSGKSFLGRVIIEEAAACPGLNILVLDPRNQSVGLLMPEDRSQILDRYSDFGLQRGAAKAFDFKYFAPALGADAPVPANLSTLAHGRSIVSFKGMSDRDRCSLAADIMEGVFAAISDHESERPRLLLLIDEAQLLIRRRVDDSAKAAAERCERALDKFGREARKFGGVMCLFSQSMKDLQFGLATLRQMMTTKVFMRNTDAELVYATDLIGDGRLLAQLPTGCGILHHPDIGTIRFQTRPPFSKVFEPSEADVRQLLNPEAKVSRTISNEAQRVLTRLREHSATCNIPINLSRLAEISGVTSRRKLMELIAELEQARAIHSSKLPDRGRPRVFELVR